MPNDVVEEVIKAVIAAARTGEIGDGRVFVLPVERRLQHPHRRDGTWCDRRILEREQGL